MKQFERENLFEEENSEEEEEENNNQEETNFEGMDLLSFKLPKFTGDGIQDPEEWLKEFEKVAIINQWNEERTKERLYGFLGEEVEEWYKETYVLENDRFPTLAELKTSFRNTFCNQK